MLSHRSVQILFFSLFLVLATGCGHMLPPGGRDDLITYTVKPGDTLYSISWRYGYDPREVAAWNHISPPYSIYPGQELMIISPYQMDARERPARVGASSPAVASATVPPAGAVSSPRTRSQTPPPHSSRKPSRAVVAKTSPTNIEKPSSSLQTSRINWLWPTDGTIVNTYSPSNGKKGLDISGRLGQGIFAAAEGVVVYSGSGLIGYGNLVIVKHNDNYLSAYGHNRRLLVKEGEKVKPGEKIAEMGDSGKDGIILHFEIRRDGKPVDPLGYLPKRR